MGMFAEPPTWGDIAWIVALLCVALLPVSMGVAILRHHVGIIGKVQLLRGPLRNRPAAEEPNLRGDEIVAVGILLILLARLFIADRNRRWVGLERNRGAINGRGQQRNEYGAEQSEPQTAKNQPPPMVQDPQEHLEVENIDRRIGPLAAAQRSIGPGIVRDWPLALASDSQIGVHAVRSIAPQSA